VCVKLRIEHCIRGENMIPAENDVCTACEGARNLVGSRYTGVTDYCSYDCPLGLQRKLDKTSKAALAAGGSLYKCVPCPADTPFLYVGTCWEECKLDAPGTLGGMFTLPSTKG
jgi:hypothetical protein